jgi:hypothetical protein
LGKRERESVCVCAAADDLFWTAAAILARERNEHQLSHPHHRCEGAWRCAGMLKRKNVWGTVSAGLQGPFDHCDSARSLSSHPHSPLLFCSFWRSVTNIHTTPGNTRFLVDPSCTHTHTHTHKASPAELTGG